MKSYNKTRTIQSLTRDIKKNKIVLDTSIQRKEDQWDRKKKSLLILSGIQGIIIPGIKTSFNALFKKTSKLEEVGIEKPKNVVGRDTISSLQSGMVYGMSSTIDGLIKKMKQENGEAKVVVTGGEARFVIDILEEDVIYDENLLLDGLRILYLKNKK